MQGIFQFSCKDICLINIQVINGLDLQIRDLREELVSANALRRQQLVELGLLREEERQKSSREHDVALAKLEAEIDRQRIELHQQHASEMERHTLKVAIPKLVFCKILISPVIVTSQHTMYIVNLHVLHFFKLLDKPKHVSRVGFTDFNDDE